jgi:1-acyl-sn-glycerol-3-phosphate acyltransferase
LKAGSVLTMLEQCRRLVVDEHQPVLVFPEGTRDGALQLKPFKRGMFDFCVRHRTHILVMAIDGAQRCWPPSYPGPWFNSGDLHVAFGPVLPPGDDVDALMDKCRSAMQQLIDAMPTPNPQSRESDDIEPSASSSPATSTTIPTNTPSSSSTSTSS